MSSETLGKIKNVLVVTNTTINSELAFYCFDTALPLALDGTKSSQPGGTKLGTVPIADGDAVLSKESGLPEEIPSKISQKPPARKK